MDCIRTEWNTISHYSTAEKWKAFREDKAWEALRESYLAAGMALRDTPIEPVVFQDWRRYAQDGTRGAYETPYFARRERLIVFAVLVRMGEDSFLDALLESIWRVCDEFSWALPAHLDYGKGIGEMPGEIDLFSAETAHALGEMCMLLGDILPAPIQERIAYEVRRRIITPFLEGKRIWRWEAFTSNWASVCGCGILHAFLYLGSAAELELALPRLLGYADRYLSGLSPDGVCIEGNSYWLYGFGYFIQMAESLYLCTAGAINYFAHQAVQKSAFYYAKTKLCDRYAVMISDVNDQYFFHNTGLTQKLHECVGSPLLPLALERKLHTDSCYHFGTLLRDILWSDRLDAAPDDQKDVYFAQTGWYIAHRAAYAAVLQSGNNGESHNHNDIGNISLVTSDCGYVLCDIGAGDYTADYFAEKRYEICNNSSLGHSVPIVAGKGQAFGAQYRGTMQAKPDNGVVCVDMTQAYDGDALQRLTREVVLGEQGLVLTDRFDLREAEQSLTERFVTRILPVQTEDCLRVGNVEIRWNSEVWQYTLGKTTYADHDRQKQTLYCMDFQPRNPAQRQTFEMTLTLC